jgi:hypothetical protein
MRKRIVMVEGQRNTHRAENRRSAICSVYVERHSRTPSRCRFAPSVEISTHVPVSFTVNPNRDNYFAIGFEMYYPTSNWTSH